MRLSRNRQQGPIEPRPPRPTGVTVLGMVGFLTSILLVIAASLTFIFAGLSTLASQGIRQLVNNNIQNSGANNPNAQNFTGPILNQITGAANAVSQALGIFGNILSIAALILLLTMLLLMGTSWGLWTGHNWARILTIIFLALETIASLLILGGSVYIGFLANGVNANLTNIQVGIGLLGAGWLTVNLYLIYYLTRNSVTTYFKRPHAEMKFPTPQPIPLTTPPQPAKQ